MLFSDDMRELLQLFEKNDVEYVLVGGFAVNYYGYVRTTQDIDFLILPSAENAQRLMQALSDFGFGGAGIPIDCFEQPGSAVHLGVEPNRIDLLTKLKGVSCSTVFAGARRVEIEGTQLNIISLEHLVEAKQNSNRPRDLADADELLRINSVDPLP
ncbi:MAG: hypothetical protein GY906_06385 [bacterium]|nr:hypothetical protein [bacterium]